MNEIVVLSASAKESELFYTNPKTGLDNACIGHLRIDFDRGKTFYSSWFEHNKGLHTESFSDELDHVINTLRNSLLKDRTSMKKYIERHPSLPLETGNGFKVVTDQFVYYFRCKPMLHCYDCYCYCYKRSLLEAMIGEVD